MLEAALTLLGTPVTWLELIAFVLALGCIVCNALQIHWGWPLAIASSLLYAWLFRASKLYGDAALQLFFVATAGWGWWQWLFGRRAAAPLSVVALQARQWLALVVAWLAAWAALGWFLARYTDTDVPWFDAFPTAGSLIGQLLLARKFIDNWPVWIVVNLVFIALYVYKNLWLTALLYALFIGLAVWGWMSWQAALQRTGQARAAA
jgi:nicotinamide mononucleotide transporter